MKNIASTSEALRFTLDGSQYSEAVIYKCFYWYGKDFSVSIDKMESDFAIVLTKRDDTVLNPEELIRKINRDLNDFKLRAIVSDETRNIRELLIAKAFAHYEEEDPDSEISDPVGFNPNHI